MHYRQGLGYKAAALNSAYDLISWNRGMNTGASWRYELFQISAMITHRACGTHTFCRGAGVGQQVQGCLTAKLLHRNR